MVAKIRKSGPGWRRCLIIGLMLALFPLLAGAYWTLRSYGQIVSGFSAKNLCSGVFVSGRAAHQVLDQDILVYSPKFLFAAIRWSVDANTRVVNTSLPWGLGNASARFRASSGCALSASEDPPSMTARVLFPASFEDSKILWPAGSKVDLQSPEHPGRAKLETALARGFAESDTTPGRRTRAIVVVHKGQIVAEQYADGFGPQTRMAGWSMAKSITSAWVGVLTRQNKLRVDDPLALSFWRGGADTRNQLSFRQLLNMSSGLEFSEAYGSPFSDVNRMLFFSQNTGEYAAGKRSIAAAGSIFNYSSGTTNLISLALRERLAVLAGRRLE